VESMQEVFREMSTRDKGAAKALREKLDELRRAKAQEALAQEWAHKGEALRDAPRINLARRHGLAARCSQGWGALVSRALVHAENPTG